MGYQLDGLSQRDIAKVVASRSVQSPLVVYGVTVSLLAIAFSVVISANPFSIGLAVLAAGCSVGGYILNRTKRATVFAQQAVEQYRQEIVAAREAALAKLRSQLEAFNYHEGQKQIVQLRQKFSAFKNILNTKLNKTELTYTRYLSMAEQVYLGAIDNLSSAVAGLTSISAIDAEHIKKQLDSGGIDASHKSALQDRLSLFEHTQGRVRQLLIDNEQAMTELDRVSIQLAQVSTQSGQAELALEDATKELRLMAERTSRYDNTKRK